MSWLRTMVARIVAGSRPPAARRPDFKAVILCQIVNYSLLRRQLGCGGVGALVEDISRALGEAVQGVVARVVAQDTLELTFWPETPERVHDAIRDWSEIIANRAVDRQGLVNCVARFGAAFGDSGQCSDLHLLEAAESALDQAKEGAKNCTLDLSRNGTIVDRSFLKLDLPRGISEGQMFLQYQPKVHVRRQKIVSAEALVRWQHPEYGLILPGEFIAAAEQAELIGRLTLWTLRRAISDQRLFAEGGNDLPVFLNMSGQLLASEDFVQEVCEILEGAESKIGLEITETSVIRDPEVAIRHLQRFASKGIKIAIDDYGAGLSSLAYLKQLPASELKIDKMFVTQLTSSNRDPLIVRSTIDLAHALEMEVTAEGVETPAALALLSVMGCDLVQGFLISRPLGVDAFKALLEASEDHVAACDVQASFAANNRFWQRAS